MIKCINLKLSKSLQNVKDQLMKMLKTSFGRIALEMKTKEEFGVLLQIVLFNLYSIRNQQFMNINLHGCGGFQVLFHGTE